MKGLYATSFAINIIPFILGWKNIIRNSYDTFDLEGIPLEIRTITNSEERVEVHFYTSEVTKLFS